MRPSPVIATLLLWIGVVALCLGGYQGRDALVFAGVVLVTVSMTMFFTVVYLSLRSQDTSHLVQKMKDYDAALSTYVRMFNDGDRKLADRLDKEQASLAIKLTELQQQVTRLNNRTSVK